MNSSILFMRFLVILYMVIISVKLAKPPQNDYIKDDSISLTEIKTEDFNKINEMNFGKYN